MNTYMNPLHLSRDELLGAAGGASGDEAVVPPLSAAVCCYLPAAGADTLYAMLFGVGMAGDGEGWLRLVKGG